MDRADTRAPGAGDLPADLDPRQIVISELALTLMPAAFPQLVELVYDDEFDMDRFIAERQMFLRRLFTRLAEVPT
ncbi:MAG: hypothetical protein R2698_08485 [Microthrixaceae bacterium]